MHWWAVDANANLAGLVDAQGNPVGGNANTMIAIAAGLPPASQIGFIPKLPDLTLVQQPPTAVNNHIITNSTANGTTEAVLWALREGRVLIIVIAEYPQNVFGQHVVFPEFIRWNFWTEQLEKEIGRASCRERV